jgi:hypothetical protein
LTPRAANPEEDIGEAVSEGLLPSLRFLPTDDAIKTLLSIIIRPNYVYPSSMSHPPSPPPSRRAFQRQVSVEISSLSEPAARSHQRQVTRPSSFSMTLAASRPGSAGGESSCRCPDYFRKERSACREERPEGRPKDRERERERDARVHAKGYIEREGEQITAEARGREAAVGVRGWFLGRRAAGES